MAKKSKRNREIAGLFDSKKVHTLVEAIEILQRCPKTGFDQSVELALKTSVDARKSDQQVRGTVSLPNGTGKTIVLLAFARGDKVKEALEAGADFAGGDELVEKVKGGWVGFDAVVSTPDMMREVGKLGKVLGPRGLMPTPKAGSVTNDLASAIADIKAGKVEYRIDKSGVVNNLVGKLSFSTDKLVENIKTLLSAIVRAKPPTAKGQYLTSLVVSSTMGPGVKVDINQLDIL